MKQNIYAHTGDEHPYPGYISVNRREDETVEITVRGKATEDGREGPVALCVLNATQFEDLLASAAKSR